MFCVFYAIHFGIFNMPIADVETYKFTGNYDKRILGKLVELNPKLIIVFNTTKTKCLDFILTNNQTLISHSEPKSSMTKYILKEIYSTFFSYCKCDFERLVTFKYRQMFKLYCYSNVDISTELCLFLAV